jgi:hypothetical protein
MMSRQDYQAIAAILKDARRLPPELGPVDTVEAITSALSCYFADNNKAFDQVRFANAVGV